MGAKDPALEQEILKFLRRSGYSVTAPKLVVGRSGSNEKFDISAAKGDEEILFDITSAPIVGSEQVVAFVAKTFETRPKRPILICVPALNHDAKSLVAMYKIETVTAKDTQGVLTSLSEILAPRKN